MSEGWKNGVWALFKCPVCDSEKYVPVRVKKPDGHWYQTEFYKCFRCSVLFHDPVQFSLMVKENSATQDYKPTATWGMPAPTLDKPPEDS